jgi:hypothetical protein
MKPIDLFDPSSAQVGKVHGLSGLKVSRPHYANVFEQYRTRWPMLCYKGVTRTLRRGINSVVAKGIDSVQFHRLN